MRILVLTNFYPPHYVGGYELACKDVVDGLEKRGHEVFVLTSRYGASDHPVQHRVYRWLHLHWFTDAELPRWQFVRTQIQNGRYIRSLTKRFSPDIIYVWNMDRLGRPLLRTFVDCLDNHGEKTLSHSIPVVFAISDRWLLGTDRQYQQWLEYWEHLPENSVKRLVKSLLKQLVSHYLPVTILKPQLQYAHFFSRSLQQHYARAGILLNDFRIIYHGVPIEQYSNRSTNHQELVKLLYCGQIVEHKGVHTALEAVATLVQQKQFQNIRLTIIGSQPFPDYVARLQKYIQEHQLQQIANICTPVTREQVEQVYNNHDFLLFPSIWEEPFSITILEAMAHGLVVISTPTGGSAEILRDGENSLIFQAEDADALANRIELLIRNPELAKTIRMNAIETVRSEYSFEKIIGDIEEYLLHIVEKN